MVSFPFSPNKIDRSSLAGVVLLFSTSGFVNWLCLLLGDPPAPHIVRRVWPWFVALQLVCLALALILRGRVGARAFRTRADLVKRFELVGDESVLCLDHRPLQISEAVAARLTSGRVTDVIVWEGREGAYDWSHARALLESQRFSGRLEFGFQKGNSLPGYDDSFDVAYLGWAEKATLVEAARLLKPGGRLFLAGTYWPPALRKQLALDGLSIVRRRLFLTEARKAGSAPRGLRRPVQIDVTVLPALDEMIEGRPAEA